MSVRRSVPRWAGVLGLALVALGLPGVPGPRPAAAETELVIYSSRHYGQEPAFDAFTKATGIKLKMFHASDAQIFERLKTEGARSPADVLLTVDAGNLWNAAQAGLLSPIDSRDLQANIPAHLRDPQNRWFALAVRARTIMYHPERVKLEDVPTYASLGEPRWRGRLCLRTSTHVYNQSLLAAMIKRYGESRSEEMVKAWVANQPILINSDTKILEAIAAGQCDVGLTNTYYLARILEKDPTFPVRAAWADQAGPGVHVNVSGGGVTTHAKHRAEAIRFLEFLSTPEAQTAWATQSMEFPANRAAAANPILAKWGPFKMDELNIGAAGELQPAATRLADRAGYK